MASVIGITKPIPSKEKIAVPMRRTKSVGLNHMFISPGPLVTSRPISFPQIYINPKRIKPSAMRAVNDSFAKLRIKAKGRRIISCDDISITELS